MLGSHVRCEQVEKERDAVIGDPRSCAEPKHFLYADSENWRLTVAVLEGDAAAAGHSKVFGGIAFKGGPLPVRESAADDIGDGEFAELFKRAFALADGREHVVPVGVVEGREFEFGSPSSKAANTAEEICSGGVLKIESAVEV